MAEMSEEPPSAKAEFFMAVAGLLSSVLISGVFGALWWSGKATGWPDALLVVFGYLAFINIALAVFNMLPGFPLDGGRVFRAIVWSVTGNLRRATQIATGLGRLVAFGFIFWGIWQIFGGNWANGLWIGFIGWFLQNAATASYRRVALQEMLAGHTAREVMMTD